MKSTSIYFNWPDTITCTRYLSVFRIDFQFEECVTVDTVAEYLCSVSLFFLFYIRMYLEIGYRIWKAFIFWVKVLQGADLKNNLEISCCDDSFNCRLTVSSSKKLFFATIFLTGRNNLYFWLDFQTYNAILYGVVIICNTTIFLLL